MLLNCSASWKVFYAWVRRVLIRRMVFRIHHRYSKCPSRTTSLKLLKVFSQNQTRLELEEEKADRLYFYAVWKFFSAHISHEDIVRTFLLDWQVCITWERELILVKIQYSYLNNTQVKRNPTKEGLRSWLHGHLLLPYSFQTSRTPSFWKW